ncbi:MAG: cytochrome c3 family protein [Candidatus Latescibacterota bacterium]
MSKVLMFIGAWLVSFCFLHDADANTCITCHKELDEAHLSAPVKGMELDIHARRGLSCVDCHGGDATSDDIDESMSADKGYVGVPDRNELPQFCGKCHQDAAFMRQFNPSLRVDQVELYWTSVHGQKLNSGDEKVATCVDCHNVHGILPSSDPRSSVYATNVPQTCGRCHADAEYMASYGIPTHQLEQYQKSVHGRMLLESGGRGAPACNDCHGNHGAAPPGVSSVSNVCGQCHPVNAELIAQSPHAEAFEEAGIAACESCHGHHDIQRPSHDMLGTGKDAVCVMCHEEDSNGYTTASAMSSLIGRLQSKHDQASELLDRAEQAGMEVREAQFTLHEVESFITKARATQHAVSLAKLQIIVDEGDSLANVTVQEGESALAELGFRRRGLQISMIFIFVLGISLYLKIREVDRKHGLE